MDLVEVGWISYRDWPLAARSIRSFSGLGARQRVLINGATVRRQEWDRRLEVTSTKQTIGLGDAFNRLLLSASAEFLFLVDTDMYWPAAQPFSALEAELGLAGDRTATITLSELSPAGRPIASGTAFPRILDQRLRTSSGLHSHAAPLGGTLYRVSAARAVGGVARHLDWGDHDLDLAWKLRDAGWESTRSSLTITHDIASALKPEMSGRCYRAMCTRGQLLTSLCGPRAVGAARREAMVSMGRPLLRAARPRRMSSSGRRAELRRAAEYGAAFLTMGRKYVAPGDSS